MTLLCSAMTWLSMLRTVPIQPRRFLMTLKSLDLGHPGLQEDYNPPRIPSSIEVHSVPPLLPSFPLLQAMANPAIKPQSTAYFAARDPKMATTVELLPALMCSEAAESIDVGHPKLQHLATQDGNGNPLRIPSTVHNHSIPFRHCSHLHRCCKHWQLRPSHHTRTTPLHLQSCFQNRRR